MEDDFPVAKLIPVSEWVYSLYRVRFWDCGGVLLDTRYLVSSCENHIVADCNEAASTACYSFTWECIRDVVPAPRIVGWMHGQPVHETGWSAGDRLCDEYKLA